MRHQTGAAAVEMAIVLPLLIMVLFGVLEFGRIFGQDLGMGNGAREAARYAATGGDLKCSDLYDQAILASRTTLLDPKPAEFRLDVYVGVAPPDDPDLSKAAEDACVDGSAEPDEGASPATPCKRTLDPPPTGAEQRKVYVKTTYDSTLLIPFAVNEKVFELIGEGVFVCEFS